MLVSLDHPQTHVGEAGEPSKFEKKFVQDSCTVYMILVHKPLTAMCCVAVCLARVRVLFYLTELTATNGRTDTVAESH